MGTSEHTKSWLFLNISNILNTMNNELVVGKIEFGHQPKAAEHFNSVNLIINDTVAMRMHKALCVIALDPNIQHFLTINDAKALQQVKDAIAEYKDSYQWCYQWCDAL